MRHLLHFVGVIFLALLFTGCASAPDTGGPNLNCETAQRAYAAYQAIIQAGVYEPSPEEIRAAAAAGIFLSLYCGWTQPSPAVALRSSTPFPTLDRRGVLILVP